MWRVAFGSRNLQTSPEILRITVLVANGPDEGLQRQHAERVGERDSGVSDFATRQPESRRYRNGRSAQRNGQTWNLGGHDVIDVSGMTRARGVGRYQQVD
jgi:hypothetical protein